VRAHVLGELQRTREAKDAYDRAIGLSEDDAVRRFLLEKQSQASA
jgi:predicted RNA polymerase sigma factor